MKLEVPAPEAPPSRDETQISIELWIGLVLSVLVIFFGWIAWVQPQTEPADDPFGHIEDEDDREAQRERAQFEEMVDSGRIDRIDWSDRQEEATRIFQIGPRDATEVVCRQYQQELSEGMMPRPMMRALLRAVSRRADDAPWTCLVDRYLHDALPDDSALSDEVVSFWRDVEWVEHHGAIMAGVVADFHGAEQRVDTEQFRQWLRRCAIAVDYGAAEACQRLIADEAPHYGADLLETLIDHLDEDDVDERDLRLASQALTYFARYGQPLDWTIEETPELPDYNVDFRLGALFLLCRFINSPDEEIREYAVEGFGRVAEVAGRPTSPHMQYRWRKSCRHAFGDAEDPPARLPMLGVVSLDGDEETVDYGMQTLIDAGYCEAEPGVPLWYCGAQHWTGGGEAIRRVLGNYFALTSYIEWYEIEELAQVMPEK